MMTETGFGPRYEVHGELSTPEAAAHECVPFGNWTRKSRLITAYPSEVS
jgi:hypothetical protein